MKQEVRGVKRESERKKVATYRKAMLAQAGRVYADLARVADVTYSMADKFVNGRRSSDTCERAFRMLTGHSPWPEGVAA